MAVMNGWDSNRHPEEIVAARYAFNLEMAPLRAINDADERMLRGDVKYRSVTDLATLGS